MLYLPKYEMTAASFEMTISDMYYNFYFMQMKQYKYMEKIMNRYRKISNKQGSCCSKMTHALIKYEITAM